MEWGFLEAGLKKELRDWAQTGEKEDGCDSSMKAIEAMCEDAVKSSSTPAEELLNMCKSLVEMSVFLLPLRKDNFKLLKMCWSNVAKICSVHKELLCDKLNVKELLLLTLKGLENGLMTLNLQLSANKVNNSIRSGPVSIKFVAFHLKKVAMLFKMGNSFQIRCKSDVQWILANEDDVLFDRLVSIMFGMHNVFLKAKASSTFSELAQPIERLTAEFVEQLCLQTNQLSTFSLFINAICSKLIGASLTLSVLSWNISILNEFDTSSSKDILHRVLEMIGSASDAKTYSDFLQDEDSFSLLTSRMVSLPLSEMLSYCKLVVDEGLCCRSVGRFFWAQKLFLSIVKVSPPDAVSAICCDFIDTLLVVSRRHVLVSIDYPSTLSTFPQLKLLAFQLFSMLRDDVKNQILVNAARNLSEKSLLRSFLVKGRYSDCEWSAESNGLASILPVFENSISYKDVDMFLDFFETRISAVIRSSKHHDDPRVKQVILSGSIPLIEAASFFVTSSAAPRIAIACSNFLGYLMKFPDASHNTLANRLCMLLLHSTVAPSLTSSQCSLVLKSCSNYDGSDNILAMISFSNLHRLPDKFLCASQTVDNLKYILSRMYEAVKLIPALQIFCFACFERFAKLMPVDVVPKLPPPQMYEHFILFLRKKNESCNNQPPLQCLNNWRNIPDFEAQEISETFGNNFGTLKPTTCEGNSIILGNLSSMIDTWEVLQTDLMLLPAGQQSILDSVKNQLRQLSKQIDCTIGKT